MPTMDQLKVLVLFGPVLALLAIGSWLTLRSGMVQVGSSRGMRRVAENFSRMAALTVACLAVLAAVQGMVGFKLSLIW